jgi:hypothetical protein
MKFEDVDQIELVQDNLVAASWFHKIRDISWPVQRLSAFQEGLIFMKLVNSGYTMVLIRWRFVSSM